MAQHNPDARAYLLIVLGGIVVGFVLAGYIIGGHQSSADASVDAVHGPKDAGQPHGGSTPHAVKPDAKAPDGSSTPHP